MIFITKEALLYKTLTWWGMTVAGLWTTVTCLWYCCFLSMCSVVNDSFIIWFQSVSPTPLSVLLNHMEHCSDRTRQHFPFHRSLCLWVGLSEQLLFQAVVASLFSHELLVGSLLHHGSVLDEDDVIGLLHGLQLVSHHHHCASTGQDLLQHLRHRSTTGQEITSKPRVNPDWMIVPANTIKTALLQLL